MSSSWLMDLIAFLNSVFLSFTNLPVKLAQMTCMSVLQHLAKSIYGMLLDDNVKALSGGVLQQIDLDVVQCEQFAASEPVPGLEVSNITYQVKCSIMRHESERKNYALLFQLTTFSGGDSVALFL